MSSVDGGGGAGGAETTLLGDEESCLGGDGVNERMIEGEEWAIGGLRTGSADAEGVPLTDKDANAVSRSFEW